MRWRPTTRRWRSSPDFAVAHFNRGAVLSALKRHDDALASYDRALAFNGRLCRGAQQPRRLAGGTEAARRSTWRATTARWRVSPDFAEALQNRGAARSHLGTARGGRRGPRDGAPREPRSAVRQGNLAAFENALLRLARIPAGIAAGNRRRACGQARDRAVHVSGGFRIRRKTSSPVRGHGCATSVRHSAGAAWTGGRYRHERIRLAYVSAHFRDHPMGHLMAALFEQHDRNAIRDDRRVAGARTTAARCDRDSKARSTDSSTSSDRATTRSCD